MSHEIQRTLQLAHDQFELNQSETSIGRRCVNLKAYGRNVRCFRPRLMLFKSNVVYYYTSWKSWKIRDWSGHDNSNSGFNINVMFKYWRNES